MMELLNRRCGTEKNLPKDLLPVIKAAPFCFHMLVLEEPGSRSRYSDCLRAGRLRGKSSSPVESRIFFSPNRPDRLRGSPNLLSSGYRG
jgi:hypothetical protein